MDLVLSSGRIHLFTEVITLQRSLETTINDVLVGRCLRISYVASTRRLELQVLLLLVRLDSDRAATLHLRSEGKCSCLSILVSFWPGHRADAQLLARKDTKAALNRSVL